MRYNKKTGNFEFDGNYNSKNHNDEIAESSNEYSEDSCYHDNEITDAEAETEEFIKLRDRITKTCSALPEQWRIIKQGDPRERDADIKRELYGWDQSDFKRKSIYESSDYINRIKQLKQMFVDFNIEYDLNISTHKYTKWQLEALNKSKQNLNIFENEVDTVLNEINDYQIRFSAHEFQKTISSAISDSERILNENQKIRYATGSGHFSVLQDRINKNNSIISTTNTQNDNDMNRLRELQNKLLSHKQKVEAFSVELPKSTKIIFLVIAVLYNYLAFKAGWGWLFLTIPLSLFYYTCVESLMTKSVQIGMFIALSVIMLTILAPFPWWMVIIAIIVAGIYVYWNKECNVK